MLPLVLMAAISCPDSSAIVQRYRRSLGATIGSTLRLTGRHEAFAWRGFRSPAGFRYEAWVGDVRSEWGSDGERFWQRTRDGFVGYAGPHRRRLIRTTERVISGAITTDPSDSAGCYRGHPDVYVRRAFYPAGGAPVVVKFNARTAQIWDARIEPDGADLVLRHVAYIASPAGRLMGSWAIGGAGFHADRAEVAANDFPARYAPPPQPASPLVSPFSLPVARANGGHALTVTAYANGVPGSFLVDSGSDGLRVTADYANRASIPLRWPTVTVDAFATTRAYASRVDALKIGPITLHGTPVIIENRGPGYDGLLGLPLFALGTVTLDASTSSLSVSPSAEPDRSAQPLLDTYDGVPIVAGSIDSRHADFVLDTGAPIDFFVPSYATVAASAASGERCPRTGLPRYMQPPRSRLGSIVVGDVVFHQQPACEFKTGLLGRYDLGLAGFDVLLRSGPFSLDYRAGRYAPAQTAPRP